MAAPDKNPKSISREQRAGLVAAEKLTQAQKVALQVQEDQKQKAKVAADAIEHRKKLAAQETERREANEKLAASLKPESPYQLEVSARLSEKTTKQLGAALQACVAKPKTKVQWVCVSKHLARETMGRAYPLALQIGIMAVLDDKEFAVKLSHNGSVIYFTWPGKEPLKGAA